MLSYNNYLKTKKNTKTLKTVQIEMLRLQLST